MTCGLAGAWLWRRLAFAVRYASAPIEAPKSPTPTRRGFCLDLLLRQEQTSLAWLLKSYLSAYGPATPEHFAQWLGVPRRWATELFNTLLGELEPVEVNGHLGMGGGWRYGLPIQVDPHACGCYPTSMPTRVGCRPREQLLPGRAAQRALTPSGQAGNYPVLLVDGSVAGVWHQRRSGRWLDITVEPFEHLTAKECRDLDEQVGRIGTFLGAYPPLDDRDSHLRRTCISMASILCPCFTQPLQFGQNKLFRQRKRG